MYNSKAKGRVPSGAGHYSTTPIPGGSSDGKDEQGQDGRAASRSKAGSTEN